MEDDTFHELEREFSQVLSQLQSDPALAQFRAEYVLGGLLSCIHTGSDMRSCTLR